MCLFIAAVPAVLGQNDVEEELVEEDQYSGEGFSLQGASGFFNVLSPVLIRPGNILAGFSYRSEFGDRGSSAPPVSIGYGLAKFSEAYVAFEPRSLGTGNEENEVLVGVKMLGFAFGNLSLGAGLAYRNVDVTADGSYAGRYMHYGGQFLLGYHFPVGLRFLGNAGYSFGDGDVSLTSDYISFGAGLSFPLRSSLLLITDAAGRILTTGTQELSATAGARYYAFEHVQVNAGLQFNRRDDRHHVGVLFGIGFSSEILRTDVEGDRGAEYFPELPSLDALESGTVDVEKDEDGSVPELPSLRELEQKEESPDADTAPDAEETVPELPSLEELEAAEKSRTDTETEDEKNRETPSSGDEGHRPKTHSESDHPGE